MKDKKCERELKFGKQVICALLILFLPILFSFFLFLIVFSLYRIRNTNLFIQKGHFFYQYYLKHNPTANSSSFGLIKLPTESISGFQTYQNEIGDFFLISKLGSQSYRCSGTCVCHNAKLDRRMNTGAAISKSLIFLVASASSLGVMSLADKYFHEQCLQHFSESCDQKNTESEVEDCDIITSDENLPNSKEQSTSTGQRNVERALRKNYHCIGKCQKVDFLQQAMNLESGGLIQEWTEEQVSLLEELEDLSRTKGCEEMEYSRDIKVQFNENIQEYFESSVESGMIPSKLYGRLEFVKYEFAKRYLNNFCLKNSIVENKSVTQAKSVGTGVCCGYQENYSTPPDVVCMEK